MTNNNRYRGTLAFLLGGLALIAASVSLAQDPPARVARLAHLSGSVSFSPGGEDEWVLARANRPLVAGDRIWADAGARAELQIGSAVVRLGANTSATLLDLNDRIAQIQLSQGSLNIRAWRADRDQMIEVDTPNLAFSIRRPGLYRIDVDPTGDSTAVSVREGQGDVHGEDVAYAIAPGQWYRFSGTGLRDYESEFLPAQDEFDRWASDRDRRYNNSVSARYVSRDVIGYQDLDDYGSWQSVPEYGNVWMPTRVDPGWAPYRQGHWAWIDPYGWTWVDDQSWGFAPFHYGRWVRLRGQWAWVPGPIAVRPVYAPALVAFIGDSSFSLSLSFGGAGRPAARIAWFPLGPGEIYRPPYRVSREYFSAVNVSNTRISNSYVTNVYNNNMNVTNVTYQNQQAPGAVTAVSATTFAQARPVGPNTIALSRQAIANAPVTATAAVAPARASVDAGAAPARVRPPVRVLERPVVASTAPPPPPAPFAAKAAALATNPGKPAESAPARPAMSEAQTPAAKPEAPKRLPPSANVPRPPEARRSPQPLEQAKAPPPSTPKAPEAIRESRVRDATANAPAQSVQKAQEAAKLPPPAAPRPPEATKARPPTASQAAPTPRPAAKGESRREEDKAKYKKDEQK